MKWNEALESNLIEEGSSCHLIIIGETKDSAPFCYEDGFQLVKLMDHELTLGLTFAIANPLEKLAHVSFIEFSFRKQGILYYSFVELKQLDVGRQQCILTLSAPETVEAKECRQFSRLQLPLRTPVTCCIAGVRGHSAHSGTVFNGQLIDICGGGLSFITAVRLFQALLLEIQFHLPHEPEKFIVLGEISRVELFGSDSYRVAIQFQSNPEHVIQSIEQYCQRYS